MGCDGETKNTIYFHGPHPRGVGESFSMEFGSQSALPGYQPRTRLREKYCLMCRVSIMTGSDTRPGMKAGRVVQVSYIFVNAS